MKHQFQEDELTEVLEDVQDDEPRSLIVFNDEINTFDHVIQTLVKVCKHTMEQAEQCTWIIHHKGKCSVKEGSLHQLRPMRHAICEAGIDARIF